MRLLLHTNVDELPSHHTTLSGEPISIEIRQTEANRIAQSTEIFISNNFILNGPPKYQDSDGDFVIMDNSESYKVSRCVAFLCLTFALYTIMPLSVLFTLLIKVYVSVRVF